MPLPRWNAHPVGRFSTGRAGALGNLPPWGVGIGREKWRDNRVEKKAGGIPVSDVECHAHRIGLIGTHLVSSAASTGAGNESGTPPPGKKEAVRRAEIPFRPSAASEDGPSSGV